MLSENQMAAHQLPQSHLHLFHYFYDAKCFADLEELEIGGSYSNLDLVRIVLFFSARCSLVWWCTSYCLGQEDSETARVCKYPGWRALAEFRFRLSFLVLS